MLDNKEDVFILAIESSCDETAAAVVKKGSAVEYNLLTDCAPHGVRRSGTGDCIQKTY